MATPADRLGAALALLALAPGAGPPIASALAYMGEGRGVAHARLRPRRQWDLHADLGGRPGALLLHAGRADPRAFPRLRALPAVVDLPRPELGRAGRRATRLAGVLQGRLAAAVARSRKS